MTPDTLVATGHSPATVGGEPAPCTWPTPWRTSRGRGRRLARRVVWWAATALVALLVLACWPQRYGGTTTVTVVAGDSMEPTYSSGDLLVTRQGTYRPGDVVVFEVPDGEPGAGHRVVHRLVAEGAAGWVTQGDNNAMPDFWTPGDDDITGGVVLHVPALGLLLVLLRTPLTWAVLGGLYVGHLLWPRAERSR